VVRRVDRDQKVPRPLINQLRINVEPGGQIATLNGLDVVRPEVVTSTPVTDR
jgi:hypothetical protein